MTKSYLGNFSPHSKIVQKQVAGRTLHGTTAFTGLIATGTSYIECAGLGINTPSAVDGG